MRLALGLGAVLAARERFFEESGWRCAATLPRLARCSTRCASVKVLPLPGQAMTSTKRSVVRTIRRCSGASVMADAGVDLETDAEVLRVDIFTGKILHTSQRHDDAGVAKKNMS